jgi:ribosomal protein S8
MDNTINNFLSQLQNESAAINSAFSSTKDAKRRKALMKQMKTMNTISEFG